MHVWCPEGKWEATAPPRWCVRLLPASKNALMPCHWKHRLVLFLLVQHVSMMVIWFVVGGPFSFFPLYSLKIIAWPYWLLIFQFQFLFFWFLILSWSFCRIFIYFQFHHSITIYQILYSPIWLSFLWFLVFCLCLFVWVLLIFNFTIQFKLMVLYFSN